MVSILQARAKAQAASPLSCLRRNQAIQTVIISLCLSVLFTALYVNLFQYESAALLSDVSNFSDAHPSPSLSKNTSQNMDEDKPDLKKDFTTWTRHLRNTEGGIYTRRTACREMEAMAQTCVFEGVICMDADSKLKRGRPRVYFVDDGKEDGADVESDNWCGYRYQAADPRYYSSRHWPPWEHTVVPQHSCMEAWYRTSGSLFGAPNQTDPSKKRSVKWLSSVALMDFDFLDNNHNGHFASDTLWVLDARLFQKSLDMKQRPGYTKTRATGDDDTNLLLPDVKYYFPHTKRQFEHVSGRDVNRLLFATILGKDLRKLYPTLDDAQLHAKAEQGKPRYTARLFDAYPELDDILQFHSDYQDDEDTDLVCTPRLTGGYKSGFSMHERACRYIRKKAFELYNVPEAPMTRVGQIFFPQPPKSITVLNRHLTRPIGNHVELMEGLKKHFEPMGVNVTYLDTSSLMSAEDFVRIYSEPGIMISPHGSQNMAQMWMQRYAAMIEIMPVGYTEFSFNMLSVPCKTWFYELHSMAISKDREKYEKECGNKSPHMFMPCINFKSEPVWVNVTKMIPVVLHALERLGYHTGHIWFDEIYQ